MSVEVVATLYDCHFYTSPQCSEGKGNFKYPHLVKITTESPVYNLDSYKLLECKTMSQDYPGQGSLKVLTQAGVAFWWCSRGAMPFLRVDLYIICFQNYLGNVLNIYSWTKICFGIHELNQSTKLGISAIFTETTVFRHQTVKRAINIT